MAAALCLSFSALAFADDAPPDGEAYLAASTAERAAKYSDAAAAYSACADRKGSLAAYARVRAAFCRAAAGDRNGAEADYRALAKEPATTPWARQARMNLAALLALQLRYDEAAALYQEALDFDPHPWWVNKYERAAAECCVKSAKFRDRGYAFFRNLVMTTRYRQPRLDAVEYLMKSANTQDGLTGILGLLKSGSYTDAAQALVRIATPLTAEDPTFADWARLPGAIGKKDEPLSPENAELIRNALKAHPGNVWIKLWLTYAARSLAADGDTGKSRAFCDLLVEYYPKSEETGDALWALAYRLQKTDEGPQAIVEYRRLAQCCPDHFRADDALLAASELYRGNKQHDDAVATASALVKQYPNSPYLDEVWYEAALARTASGRAKDALDCLRETAKAGVGHYYAHRALARLHAATDTAVPSSRPVAVAGKTPFLRAFPIPPEPPALPKELLGTDRFRRLAFFAAHGLEEAEWEALDLARFLKDDPNAPATFQALSEAGLACTAMNYADAFGWGVKDRKSTVARLRVEYPRAYWPHVLEIAKETGVDPYLILAVARQESTFRPALTSYAGARGVMQVMPGTATQIDKSEPNVGPEHVANLESPMSSLRLGAYYLMRMLERSDGNVAYALASYNAGPGNCDKWRKASPDADLETFVESIPFTETNDYVKRVLGNYAAYYSLYPPVGQ